LKDLDCVVKNGTVVTAAATFAADIGIRGETIAAIGLGLEGDQILDAAGLYVLPGFVDSHVHLQMTVGDMRTADDFASGTIAAACGGTTTIVDFTSNLRGDDLARGAVLRRREADNHVAVDYNLHLTLADASDATMAALPLLAREGYASAKLYTTYDGLRLDDHEILTLLEATSRCGILPLVHAENHAAIQYLTADLLRQGKTAPEYHPLSRPPEVEAEAAHRVLALAGLVKAPVFIAHLTCRQTLEAVRMARGRGQQVYAETCPHYLLLSDRLYKQEGFQAAKVVLSPPLRAEENCEILWTALRQGELQSVSTDHCPWNYASQKVRGRDSFARIPNGAPGIETRMPLLLHEAFNNRRLPLERLVEVCSTAPARLHGLYPVKGTIAVGSDADLVFFDPHRPVTLSQATLHQDVDYCPFEGTTVQGYPSTVMLRGQIIVRDGKYVGHAGQGRFVPAQPFRYA